MKRNFLAIALIFMAAQFNCVQSQNASGYHLINTFIIKSDGWWDYLAIDAGSDKLYVSHGTQVNILDKNTGDSLGVIPNTSGIHGIAFVPQLNKGYTSNGKLNNVSVFDLKTDTVIKQIATGQNPDAIFYDQYSGKIITCNGKSKDLTIIDPVNDKVVATIALSGKPETAVSNNTGKIYINDEDNSTISVVDINTYAVINTWSLAPGEAPSGLAIDLTTNRLFAGCENKLMVILDAETGKLIDTPAIGDGCDGVAFEAASQFIFSSNGEGTLTILKEINGNKFAIVENVKTKRGARTICIDPQTKYVYLPTALFEPGGKENERPKMIPGTFQILVFGK